MKDQDPFKHTIVYLDKKVRFEVSKEAQAQICTKTLASPNKMKMSISCELDLFGRNCLRS